jgi:hypothetical protein
VELLNRPRARRRKMIATVLLEASLSQGLGLTVENIVDVPP